MEQLSAAKFQSEDSKVQLICEGSTPLGDIHDFLMAAKGEIVNRMVAAQQREEEQAQEQKAKEEEECQDKESCAKE